MSSTVLSSCRVRKVHGHVIVYCDYLLVMYYVDLRLESKLFSWFYNPLVRSIDWVSVISLPALLHELTSNFVFHQDWCMLRSGNPSQCCSFGTHFLPFWSTFWAIIPALSSRLAMIWVRIHIEPFRRSSISQVKRIHFAIGGTRVAKISGTTLVYYGLSMLSVTLSFSNLAFWFFAAATGYLEASDRNSRASIESLLETQMFSTLLQRRGEGRTEGLVFFEKAGACTTTLQCCFFFDRKYSFQFRWKCELCCPCNILISCWSVLHTITNSGALVRELGLSAGGHGSNQNNRNANEVLEVRFFLSFWCFVVLLRCMWWLFRVQPKQSWALADHKLRFTRAFFESSLFSLPFLCTQQMPLPVYGLLSAAVQWSGLGQARQQQLRNNTYITGDLGGSGGTGVLYLIRFFHG